MPSTTVRIGKVWPVFRSVGVPHGPPSRLRKPWKLAGSFVPGRTRSQAWTSQVNSLLIDHESRRSAQGSRGSVIHPPESCESGVAPSTVRQIKKENQRFVTNNKLVKDIGYFHCGPTFSKVSAFCFCYLSAPVPAAGHRRRWLPLNK